MKETLIYVQLPPSNVLTELLNNPPQSVLVADYKAVIWLDQLKRAAQQIK